MQPLYSGSCMSASGVFVPVDGRKSTTSASCRRSEPVCIGTRWSGMHQLHADAINYNQQQQLQDQALHRCHCSDQCSNQCNFQKGMQWLNGVPLALNSTKAGPHHLQLALVVFSFSKLVQILYLHSTLVI